MKSDPGISKRKQDHIAININKDVSSLGANGFQKYRLIHNALPQIDLAEVDLSTTLFNKHIDIPLLISSMTGGTKKGKEINFILAEVAQEFNIAMGVGSQRIGLENADRMDSFQLRKAAPNILLFANVGAIQLNNDFTVDECKRAVESIEADGLILHLNPLQEALMLDGDTNFSGLLAKIGSICGKINSPVVVKEVGWGISAATAGKLYDVGVAAIDVAGAGGTSWSEVERYRAENRVIKETASAFRGWGIPTAEALENIREKFPDKMVFASGGFQDGVEIIKALALGAKIGGMAGKFLRAAAISIETLQETVSIVSNQMKITAFVVGAKNLASLRNNKIEKIL